MTNELDSVSIRSARNLATTTKSAPLMEEITPRWLLKLLTWISVEAGVYRTNRFKVILAV